MLRPSSIFLVAVSVVTCSTPSGYSRDVMAYIEGPSRIRVGESAGLTARLDYSDGSGLSAASQHVDWVSSSPALTIGAPASAGIPALVTGVTPGEVVVSATPNVLIARGAQRRPGRLRVIVVE